MTGPIGVVVVWRREETHRVPCTVRRTQASEPTLTASGLAARDMPSALLIESTCLGPLYFDKM